MAFSGNIDSIDTPLDGNDTFSLIKENIPTRLSQLLNDEDFIRDEKNAFGYSNLYGVPTKVSQFSNDALYIKDEPLALNAGNLAGSLDISKVSGSNIITTQKYIDSASGVLTLTDNFTKTYRTDTYYVDEMVRTWLANSYWGELLTSVAHTCNVFLSETHSIVKTDTSLPATLVTTEHALFPSVSVHASNVIGGASQIAEDALPDYLVPTKVITLEQSDHTHLEYGNPTTNGVDVTMFSSNVRYKLPKIVVASENVLGDYLVVNSNISTSNLSVKQMNTNSIKVLTNVQVINGAVTGGFLNMTSAYSSNTLAGVLKVTGVSTPFFPEYFREFQCGQADSGNQYSAEGDPGYGAFGGFSTDPMWVSNDEYGLSKTSSKSISLEKNLKSISRYHSTKGFDDAQVKSTYQYGWNNGQRVYPSSGYTYSIFSIDSIWTQNKLLISSDERIKTNIKPMNSNICLLGARCLKPSGYTHLKDGTYRLGFIAQEVKEIIPEAVSIGEGTLPNGDKVDDFHVIDYNTITTINTSAIQALANELVELKNRMKVLEDGIVGGGHTAL